MTKVLTHTKTILLDRPRNNGEAIFIDHLTGMKSGTRGFFALIDNKVKKVITKVLAFCNEEKEALENLMACINNC